MKLWTGLIASVLALSFAGQANAGVLFNQQDSFFPESTPSQDFEAEFNIYDSMPADDFVVPAGRNWRLESALLPGKAFQVDTKPSGMRITLFADNAGVPGSQISTRVATISPDTYPSPNVNLGDQPVLAAGTYWLGVQAILNAGSAPGAQWFWGDSDAGPFGSPAHFRNPGDGFGTGCTAFDVRSTCFAGSTTHHPSHDQSFTISGSDFSAVPETAIDSGPAEGSTISTNSTSIAFSSTEPEATFQCSQDGGAFAACTSPKALSGLAEGSHSFAARVTNGLGTTDPTPASRNFSVDLPSTGPSQACRASRKKAKRAKSSLKTRKKKLSRAKKAAKRAKTRKAKAKGKAKVRKAKKAVKKAKSNLKKANRKVKKNC